MRLLYGLFVLLIWVPTAVSGQTRNAPGKELHVSRASDAIVLDGMLAEQTWKEAQVATDFFMNFPVDSLPPKFQSEVRMAFNEHFLYFGIICYDDSTRDMVQSLRRDIDWEINDNIGIYFDSFNDFTNGFFFTITPMGVQSEGILSGGGNDPESSFNDNWDNKWFSKVVRHKDHWVAELAIPFKSIRYNLKDWNMTFLRNDVKRNQVSSWIATPIQYIPASMAYAGKIIWEGELPRPTHNISFIPYVSGSNSFDREADPKRQILHNAGFDAKVAVTPSLNLDLTFRPDFSQVEVDQQVINLTRFEFGFPERRQFFLENSDLFAQQGFPFSRPFFTRRIGIVEDSVGLRRVNIEYGARLSGKIGHGWRVGVLNMQTQKDSRSGLPTQNYLVGVVQRQIFSRSNISFSYVHKQNIGLGENYDSLKYYHSSVYRERTSGDKVVREFNRFNDVLGVDFNLIDSTNTWSGDFYYHHSLETFNQKESYSYGAFVGYTKRKYSLNGAFFGLGKNYNAETGFVPNLEVYPGNFGGFLGVDYRIFPKHAKITQLVSRAEYNFGSVPGGQITDREINFSFEVLKLNTSGWRFFISRTYQWLPEDFNPLDPEGDKPLLAGTSYWWNSAFVRYQSDTRKTFNYFIRTSYGGFYNGELFNSRILLNYRYQPFGSLAVQIDYNQLNFPAEYGNAQFILFGPRLDLTFTDKLFLTTFVQYNNRDDNLNVNTRFQWRFKPASDLFVVYTENYLPGAYSSKNRAIVLKLTYWFNL